MKRTKARREHVCIHCERRIDAGEEYMRGSLGPPDQDGPEFIGAMDEWEARIAAHAETQPDEQESR